MKTMELIQNLKGKNVMLTVEGGTLKVKAPVGVLTDDLKAALREHKPEIIQLLQTGEPARMPFLSQGDIRIPFDAPAKYHWWNDCIEGRLSLDEIRSELRGNHANN